MYQRTEQWMILAANSYYLAIDLNMMLVNTILFISCAVHTSLIHWRLRNARGKVVHRYLAELTICIVHWPFLLTSLIFPRCSWTPHFPLCQLARAGNFHDIFYLLDTLSIYLETGEGQKALRPLLVTKWWWCLWESLYQEVASVSLLCPSLTLCPINSQLLGWPGPRVSVSSVLSYIRLIHSIK